MFVLRNECCGFKDTEAKGNPAVSGNCKHSISCDMRMCCGAQNQKQFQTQAALGGSPLEDGQIIHIYVYVFIQINLRRHFLPEVIQRNYFEILKYLKLITLRHSCEPNLATGYGAAVPNSGSMHCKRLHHNLVIQPYGHAQITKLLWHLVFSSRVASSCKILF